MKQLVESLKRLYMSNQISKEKIIQLFETKKITYDEKEYILN